MGAQLRDVLAAEDSAVVAQEDDHRRLSGPQEIELHGALIGIGQDDPGEALGIGGHELRL
jgi:hypothetical protein